MDDVPIVRFVGEREDHLADCTIAAFAMCLGLTYSQALVTIAAVAPRVLEDGASWGELKAAAKTIDVVLIERRTVDVNDLEETDGILGVQHLERKEHGAQHAVFFKRGLIFDGLTKCIWDADVYVSANKVKVLTMLVRKSDAPRVVKKRRRRRGAGKR